MKKIIALIAACAIMLSLTGCFGMGTGSESTADESKVLDISEYSKDYDGLLKYIGDLTGVDKQEIYYDIIGADNGARFVINNNAFIEVYDFSSYVSESATADSATPDTANPEQAKRILADIKDSQTTPSDDKTNKKPRGTFKPLEGSATMTAFFTENNQFVIAYDATRGYDYEKNIVTAELLENW